MADEITLKITLPDDISVGMWNIYQKARQDYIDARSTAKVFTTNAEAQYMGSLAVIKAGFAHLENAERLMDVIQTTTDTNTMSLSIMSFIVRSVAWPIEAAVNAPLPSYVLPLSDTKSDPSSTPVPKP